MLAGFRPWRTIDHEHNLPHLHKGATRHHASTTHARKVLKCDRYTYNFGDGWVAAVSVKEVTAKEANAARQKSSGFCGYDWMITSILDHGEIRT